MVVTYNIAEETAWLAYCMQVHSFTCSIYRYVNPAIILARRKKRRDSIDLDWLPINYRIIYWCSIIYFYLVCSFLCSFNHEVDMWSKTDCKWFCKYWSKVILLLLAEFSRLMYWCQCYLFTAMKILWKNWWAWLWIQFFALQYWLLSIFVMELVCVKPVDDLENVSSSEGSPPTSPTKGILKNPQQQPAAKDLPTDYKWTWIDKQ